MNLFDAIMTDTNGTALASKLGLTFVSWNRSGVSESTYCYMTDGEITVKVRLSTHDDKHFDGSESLGTLDITDFAEFDPTEFGEEDESYTPKEQVREDYWIERPDRFANIHASEVNRLLKRLEVIKNEQK